MTTPIDFPDKQRRKKAKEVRDTATQMSTTAPYPDHIDNTDPGSPYIFKFTKGHSHGLNGLLSFPEDFEVFVTGTENHDPNFFANAKPHRTGFLTEKESAFPKGVSPYRQWESPTAGHAYVLQGPDPFTVTIPPAPTAGSTELAAEMAEIYQMALSRDWPVAAFMHPNLIGKLRKSNGKSPATQDKARLKSANSDVAAAATRLSELRWFMGVSNDADITSGAQRRRRRFDQTNSKKGVVPSTVFRGAGEDGWDTPFLSQFMLMGGGEGGRASGKIGYGAQTVDQKVRVAVPHKDYMTTWEDWLDVQNGLNKRYLTNTARNEEFLPGETRFISSLRDMATYVHDDQLYQAYLNAALLMLGEDYPLDAGIPYHTHSRNPLSRNNREPFALFGPPHLLTLLTEVSSRALKAVRLQKFSVHRRTRPEGMGAAFHTVFTGYHPQRNLPKDQRGLPYVTGDGSVEARARRDLASTVARFTFPNAPGDEPALYSILEDIRKHNARNNGEKESDLGLAKWLLPMAFPEGSPMHPAYGAGHATVAAACVTLLKAFFNMSNPDDPTKPAYLVGEQENALVPEAGKDADDTDIDLLSLEMEKGLTLEGELNKLMWNISNARNIAGVHYYTDYIESALLGEAITLGILREQMLCYHPNEAVSMTVPLLVPRTLPECLLTDRNESLGEIALDQEVAAVKIRHDGTLIPTPVTSGRS